MRKSCARPRNHEFIILKLLRTAENESIQLTDDLGSVRPTKIRSHLLFIVW